MKEEIDFILNKQIGYEVKVTPEESALRKLHDIATELKLKEYKIVSKNYTNLKNSKYGFML